MNIFQNAIDDIFKDTNFIEHCVINDELYEVICTSVGNELVYSEAGLVDGVGFKLIIKLPMKMMPEVGDKVVFRGTQYKVASFEIDSANASVTIYLQSLSKGV